MKHIAAIVGLVALTGGLAACGGRSVGGEGIVRAEGTVQVVHGTATLLVASGTSRHLRVGDQVDVSGGSAVVTLPAGGTLELRTGSSVRFQGGPRLEAGDLLVESSRSAVRVDSAMGAVTVAGASRLRRDLAVEVGTYRGVTTVAAARTVTVPALEEDTVPAVGLVPQPSPLQLHATDAWDERFLGTAIDLTSQLDSQSSYVTANAPGGVPHTAAFYRRALPQLGSTAVFTDALLASATPGTAGGVPPPGDALVAAAIALSGQGPFSDRWRSVFALRQQGGQWGIVVLDERADPASVLRLVGGALDQAVLTPVALTATVVGSAPVATGAPAIVESPLPKSGPTTTVPPTTTTSRVPRGTKPTTPPTTRPPGTVPTITLPPLVTPSSPSAPPPPTTTPPALAPLVDPVVSLIQALTGGSSSG